MKDLGPFPRLHEREVVVREAERDFGRRFLEVMRGKNTTYVDLISGLARALVIEKSTFKERSVVEMIAEWKKAFPDLTMGEITGIISNEIASEAKYLVRVERHGDSNKPGGLADD